MSESVFVEVAVPVFLEQTFTYTYTQAVPPGCRVSIPFGESNRKLVGVALGPPEQQPGSYKLKAIDSVIDTVPLYSGELLKLARWMSHYYMHPLGEVLKTMLPASRVRKHKIKLVLTDEGVVRKAQKDEPLAAFLVLVWPRTKSCSLELFKKRRKEAEARGLPTLTWQQLVKKTWVKKEGGIEVHGRQQLEWEAVLESATGLEVALALTAAQKHVFQGLRQLLQQKQKNTALLHGVTGAGKTEIYLQLIAESLADNAENQVLVMVPEIALTPQITLVFTRRFGSQVAVVHSAMSDKDRWAAITAMSQGKKSILIGPRSAVFAPFQRLAMIIVDEEHDTSYKQSTGLCYQGRDIAVMRGSLESIFVLLGSATPSLESYANAEAGKYHYFALLERANGKGMPQVECIATDLSRVHAQRLKVSDKIPVIDQLPIQAKIIEALRQTVAQGQQAMVLVNRRGFAYFLLSLRDKKAVACPQCSISLTVHRYSTLLRCHYCDYAVAMSQFVGEDQSANYIMIGFGSEQMELFLKETLPGSRIRRVDSDVMSQKDLLPQTLQDFREGKIDILVGTQMLAKGHDFARVTLICLLEVDQLLNMPDFRAGERCFQLMVQAAGRAGRGHLEGQVLVQSARALHPVIRAGLAQDYAAFWQDQKAFRALHQYPPYGRLILFEYSSANQQALSATMQALESWLTSIFKRAGDSLKGLTVLGPTVPPLEKVRGHWRRTILLSSRDRGLLSQFALLLKKAFAEQRGEIKLRIDVDPQSLL